MSLPDFRSVILLALVPLVACAPGGPPAGTLPRLTAQDMDPALGYEPLPTLRASDLFPPEVIAGPHHRVREALEAVGLTERSQHLPAQLSVGQRQRVVIARATVMRPQLILADEPTGNLDSASSEQILKQLDQLHVQGQTLIIVTHELHVARRAERVLVIDDGQIVQRIKSAALDRDPVLHPALSRP